MCEQYNIWKQKANVNNDNFGNKKYNVNKSKFGNKKRM